MTNQEQTLLQAISNMMDQKLEEVLEQKLEEVLERKLDEILEQKLDEILDRKLAVALKPIKEDIAELKARTRNMEIAQETRCFPLIEEIHSCYMDTYERYRIGAEKMEKTFEDVSLLKKTVEQHSVILQKLTASV